MVTSALRNSWLIVRFSSCSMGIQFGQFPSLAF
jgi:hypothetical protein